MTKEDLRGGALCRPASFFSDVCRRRAAAEQAEGVPCERYFCGAASFRSVQFAAPCAKKLTNRRKSDILSLVTGAVMLP